MKLRFFGKKDEQKKLTGEQALAELGINIVTGIQLDNRLVKIKKFLDQIKDPGYDDKPIERVKLMATLVEKAIIPYGKGRDNSEFVRLINAWTRIVTMYNQLYRYPDIREKYIKTLNSMSLKEVYEPFVTILTVGFSKEDLAKNIIGVIQTFENIVPQAIPISRSQLPTGGATR